MGKKHKHAPHENLERWVVSYADFMTLLFAVFTALFAMAKAELADQKDVVEGIRQGFVDQSLISGIKSILQGQSPPTDNPNPLSSEKGAGEGVMGDFKELLPQKGQVEEDEQNALGDEGLKAMYAQIKAQIDEIQKALDEAADPQSGKGMGAGSGTGADGKDGKGQGEGGSGTGQGYGNHHAQGLGGPKAGNSNSTGTGKGTTGDGTATDGGKGAPGLGAGDGSGGSTSQGKVDASKQGAQDIQVSADERGVRIRFDSQILFHSGSAALRPEAVKALKLVAEKLSQYKNQYLIQVEGHTDNEKISSRVYPSNWELSSARASSVVRLFINEFKYPSKIMSAAGYGDSRPVASNKTAAGRAKNRRIEFVLFTDPTQDPNRKGGDRPAGESGQSSKASAKKSQPKPDKPRPSRLDRQLIQKVTVQDDDQPVKVILMQTDRRTGEVTSQKEWPVKIGGVSHQQAGSGHGAHPSPSPASGTSDHLPPHATDRIPFDE